MPTKTRTHWIVKDQAAAVSATDFVEEPCVSLPCEAASDGRDRGHVWGHFQGIAELEFPPGKSDDAMPKQLTIK